MTWQPSRLTAEQRQERRLEAGRLLQHGQLTQAEIARHLGVSRSAVSQWHKQLQRGDGDLCALQQRTRSGRPPRLTAAQWQQVLNTMTTGAQAAGFEDERWSLVRVQTLIRRRWSVCYHACYLSRRLRELGWSVQKPAVVARERDEALLRAWLQQDWPRIKKGAAARRHDSVCG